jgi:ABC-2 type transport system permease protein
MSFVFPILFVGVLGGSLQSGFGAATGKDLLTYTFLGVLAQTLFQSTASGIISLINDRENDFSQEIFVSPTNRYSLILGKIVGESSISFIQAFGILFFGLLIGIPLTVAKVALILPVAVVVALLGGAFGVMVLGNLNNERSANQLFPLIIFPQLFLAGVFVPVTSLPAPLLLLARIAPLTYAVDFMRGVFFIGEKADTLYSPWVNFGIITIMFVIFLTFGTVMFVKKERSR